MASDDPVETIAALLAEAPASRERTAEQRRHDADLWLPIHGFTVTTAEAWIRAGVHRPLHAKDLERVGLTPAQAGIPAAGRRAGITIGFLYTSGARSLAETIQAVKNDEASRRGKTKPKR